jgi:uncharacterized protein YbjT (DUF2867 family)
MTILITGAAGLNGTAAVHEFARHGEPVRALVRNRAQARELDEMPIVELVEGDMLLPATLGPALDGVDRVLLISSTGPRMADTQCTFIDAAKTAGVGHVVKFSGLNAAVDSAFRFTRKHGEIERHLEGSGLAWTHLRPSQFMQVYFREVQTIVNQDAFYLPMGRERLAPVDVADIAKVARLLMREGGHDDQSYDMTGPEALTMAEIAQRISDAVGRRIRYVDIDPDEKHRMLVDAGTEPYFADAPRRTVQRTAQGSRIDRASPHARTVRRPAHHVRRVRRPQRGRVRGKVRHMTTPRRACRWARPPLAGRGGGHGVLSRTA